MLKLKPLKGITFFENLIAVLILGFLFISVLGAFIMGKVTVTKAKHCTQAISLARAKLEQIREQSYGQIVSSVENNLILDSGPTDSDSDDLIAVRTTNVTDITTGKLIVVTLSWTEHSLGSDMPLTVSITTLVSQY